MMMMMIDDDDFKDDDSDIFISTKTVPSKEAKLRH